MINPLKALSFKLPSKHIEKIHNTFMLPILDYCDTIYCSAPALQLKSLDRTYYRAACSVSGVIHGSNTVKVLENINWQTLVSRRLYHLNCYSFNVHKQNKPRYIKSIFQQYANPERRDMMVLRNRQLYNIPARTSKRYDRSSILVIAKIINQNYQKFNEARSLSSFKSHYKSEHSSICNILPTTHLKLPIMHAKLLNRLRVGLLLNGHRYAHNFQNTPTPACPCGARTQNEKHFFLDCTLLTAQRNVLFRTLEQLNLRHFFNNLTRVNKTKFLLYGNHENTIVLNDDVMNASAKFIFDCKNVFSF